MRFLVLLVCLSMLAPSLSAQDAPASSTAAQYMGRPIVATGVVVEGRPSADPALMDLVQTRPGEPLVMAEVRESISHLFSLQRFQDVRVEAREDGDGVSLTYHLVPLHGVERLEFRGTLGLSEGLLRRTVTSRFGESPPVGRSPEIARVLEQELYRDQGYLRAEVSVRAVEEHDPERTVLVFDVDAGPRARVGQVNIEGQIPGDRAAFLRRVGAVTGAPYEPARLADELARYAEELRRSGRYDARADYRPLISPDRTVADLEIAVQPGPRVLIRFEGDPVPQDRLDELVPVRREASAHEDLLEDSELRIRNYLAQQGYWKATTSTTATESEDLRTVVFTIRKGLQYRVAQDVRVTGMSAVSLEELKPLLARLQAGEIFVAPALDAAASAIESLYRGRGYPQVAVTTAANEVNPTPDGVGQVEPAIAVTEGPQVRIGQIRFTGVEQIAEEHLRALVQVRPGDPFIPSRIVDDRERVLLEYLNQGFAGAEVTVTPMLSDDGTRADLTVAVSEGRQTRVDHILIIGNVRTDAAVIRRELLFREGQPLGLADLIESRRRLTALGLFRRVQIAELSHGEAREVDVLVTVAEAPRTTLSYGGGLEVRREFGESAGGEAEERYQFAPRGFFDIGRRNVGGKNRSLNLYNRVSLRPDSPDDGDDRVFGFIDYRVVGTYREPRPYGINGDLTVTGALEQGVRPTFNFARKGVTAEFLRRFDPGIRATGRYSFATTRIYDSRLDEEDQALIDRRFPQVRLSTVAAAVSRDTRDDILEPTRGTFVSLESSIAARALGGQVGFVKSYGQALWFTRVPGVGGIVFASRVAVGLADGFPSTLTQTGAEGVPEEVVVEDLPASERFFAGGDTTVRGFALDTLGTANTISPSGFPRGGNAIVLLNGELRIPVWGALAAAAFVDGGNVFSRVTEVDLGELRASAGFGVRYRSPIGPIRLDLGFKLNRRTFGPAERGNAFHFSFGQAF